MEPDLLVVDHVSVRFGGVQALDEVSLTATSGAVTGLIGPNGAGKTTLFNVITGLERPGSGRVLLAGEDVTRLPPYKRARRGLARTFQRLEVFGTMSTRDNLLAAAEFRDDWAKDGQDLQSEVERILDRVGLRDVAGARADALPTGLARLLELGRALAVRPRVLLLDEPGSGLDSSETDALGELLVELAAEGTAVLLVEHDVDLVMRVSQRVHVLDFGRVICAGAPAEVQRDPAVQAAYLGAAALDPSAAPEPALGGAR